MVIGLIARHFKIYKGVNYIPISQNLQNNLSIYVGTNGVGKSSILEALNAFFNYGHWNKHKEGKQDETFIAPVFLIKKNLIHLTTSEINIFNDLSNLFWDYENTSSPSEIKDFFTTREILKKNYKPDEYYFIVAGIQYKESNKIYFSSAFDSTIKKTLSSKYSAYEIDSILQIIRKFYSFIYIPVESKVSDTLKLETFEMQKLMNKDILNAIDNVLKAKEFQNPSGNGKINAVDYFNQSLNSFMDDINLQVQNIDPKYSFKVDTGYKKNLTAYDLREKILQAYFAIRTLKKETKEIYELSSGEQRIALIDIATAFLSNNAEKEGNLILAIDEPEASMHISKCFTQFKRLESITDQNNIQVMLTTHWYGSLPTIQKGNLHHIQGSEKPSFSTFDFQNYLEERRSFPDDIDMKSFFELVTTIISSIKNENINWLICEGSDDKRYLSHYLDSDVKNLRIIPVGGCGNVIKLFEYLVAPFNENKEKSLLENGRILCLIDSDPNQKTTNLTSSNENALMIKRLQLNAKNIFELKSLHNVGEYIPTVIEDCLNPIVLYKALESTIMENSQPEIKQLFIDFEFNEAINNSRIIGEVSILKPKKIEAIDNKLTLYEEFKKNDFKYALSENYVKIAKTIAHDCPEIITKIKQFFLPPVQNISVKNK